MGVETGPWRNMKFFAAEDAPIQPLIEQLGFITNKKIWGFPFRRELFEIGEADLKRSRAQCVHWRNVRSPDQILRQTGRGPRVSERAIRARHGARPHDRSRDLSAGVEVVGACRADRQDFSLRSRTPRRRSLGTSRRGVPTARSSNCAPGASSTFRQFRTIVGLSEMRRTSRSISKARSTTRSNSGVRRLAAALTAAAPRRRTPSADICPRTFVKRTRKPPRKP